MPFEFLQPILLGGRTLQQRQLSGSLQLVLDFADVLLQVLVFGYELAHFVHVLLVNILDVRLQVLDFSRQHDEGSVGQRLKRSDLLASAVVIILRR